MAQKVKLFLMVHDIASDLLSLPTAQLHAIYDSVVPEQARMVDWQP